MDNFRTYTKMLAHSGLRSANMLLIVVIVADTRYVSAPSHTTGEKIRRLASRTGFGVACRSSAEPLAVVSGLGLSNINSTQYFSLLCYLGVVLSNQPANEAPLQSYVCNLHACRARQCGAPAGR